jgi:hypothetical protein
MQGCLLQRVTWSWQRSADLSRCHEMGLLPTPHLARTSSRRAVKKQRRSTLYLVTCGAPRTLRVT